MPRPLNATCTAIQKDGATLQVTASKKITLPADYLPANTKTGDAVVVEVMSKDQYQKRQKNVAQAILTEILGASEGDNGSQKNQ